MYSARVCLQSPSTIDDLLVRIRHITCQSGEPEIDFARWHLKVGYLEADLPFFPFLSLQL
jgi:hypothetical protein